jgi:RNAse (barnase) inhibitor barstar
MNVEDALDARTGGVYRFSAGSVPPEIPAKSDQRVVHLRTRNSRDKLTFLKAVAIALQFPDYFGQNWDALYDCLTELSEHSHGSLVVVFDNLSGFARVEPEEFSAAVDALRDAAEYWASNDKRLIVLIGIEEPLLATELPELSVR